jgi:uncharacterized protein
MQSRAEVAPFVRATLWLSPCTIHGTKGNYRVNPRHGVSRLRSGQRHTLGMIFHDAK